MDGINAFDGAVMALVQEYCHNFLTDFLFPIITYLGEYGCFWILLSLFLLCSKKSRRSGILMLCAMACGLVFGEALLKNLVCRLRPFQMFPGYAQLLIPAPSGFSFPSGHTCSSFAAATVLCFSSKRWGIPALLLAGLIAFSRIFLFVHWPTDVLAGAALGVLLAVAVCLGARKVKPQASL